MASVMPGRTALLGQMAKMQHRPPRRTSTLATRVKYVTDSRQKAQNMGRWGILTWTLCKLRGIYKLQRLI
jgi:hypothetical protein